MTIDLGDLSKWNNDDPTSDGENGTGAEFPTGEQMEKLRQHPNNPFNMDFKPVVHLDERVERERRRRAREHAEGIERERRLVALIERQEKREQERDEQAQAQRRADIEHRRKESRKTTWTLTVAAIALVVSVIGLFIGG